MALIARKPRTLDQICPTRGQSRTSDVAKNAFVSQPKERRHADRTGTRHPARAGLCRDQGSPASHLGQRRLRRRRHDAADRRRVARRSRGPARRRKSARRRRRQRQCDAGGGAPLRRGHVDRLRAGAAREGTRPEPPPKGSTWTSSWPTPSSCRSPTAVSTSCCPPSAACSRPTMPASRARCCGCCARAAGSAWRTGRRRGFIGRLFKVIGAHVPPPAGLASPALWGTRAASRGAVRSARDATSAPSAGRSTSATAAPAHWVQVFRDWYGPTHKAFGALDAAGQARARTRHRRPAGRVRYRAAAARWSCRASTSRSSSPSA